MLNVKVRSRLSSPLNSALKKVSIVRMDSLQNQIGRWFRPERVSVDPIRFFGPKHPLDTRFHSGITGVAESLCFCQKVVITPQGFFDALPVLDVGHDAVPSDYVSIPISQWLSTVQMPPILSVCSAKTNLALVRFAA
jgi:hypothetical protein